MAGRDGGEGVNLKGGTIPRNGGGEPPKIGRGVEREKIQGGRGERGCLEGMGVVKEILDIKGQE